MSEPVPKSAEADEVSRADMFKPIGATAQGVSTSAAAPAAESTAAPAAPAASGAAEPEEEDDGMLAEDEEDDGPRSELLDGISTLPSLCVACEENGKTNIFPTVIPFFRDIILMSFRCQHCGHRSSEVQEMEIQEKGSRFTLQVKTAQVCDKLEMVSSRLRAVACYFAYGLLLFHGWFGKEHSREGDRLIWHTCMATLTRVLSAGFEPPADQVEQRHLPCAPFKL